MPHRTSHTWPYNESASAPVDSKDARADNLVVFDFETTGLSPDQGDRAIEVGAVRIKGGQISERFQALMNPGRPVSAFIQQFTGISSAMLHDAPPCSEGMAAFAEFVGSDNLIAHNASFDSRFLHAELARIGRSPVGAISCSLLAARRLYPDAPNHKLGTLVHYHNLPHDNRFHRALADAEMTAHLWLRMLSDLQQFGLSNIPFTLMQRLTRTPKAGVKQFLQQMANLEA